jgi:hypothetical protein
MKRRTIGLTIAVLFALTAASAAAGAEPAFIASKPGTVKLAQKGLQKYTLHNGGDVICEEVSGSTHVGSTKLRSIVVLVTSTNCEAFGAKANVSVESSLFDANGSISVLTSDKVVVEVPSAKCSVALTLGGANTALGTIKYTTEGNHVLNSAKITGLQYVVSASKESGSPCGTNKEVNVGEYTGDSTFELEGGTLKWDSE